MKRTAFLPFVVSGIVLALMLILAIASVPPDFSISLKVATTSQEEAPFPVVSPIPVDELAHGLKRRAPDVNLFPAPLKKYYGIGLSDGSGMANPKEKFRVTDVVNAQSPKLPSKRLIVPLARESDNLWAVHFEYGGIAHGYEVDFFRVEENSLAPIWKCFLDKPEPDAEILSGLIGAGACTGRGSPHTVLWDAVQGHPDIRILSIDHSAKISVEIRNAGPGKLRIWESRNSWGADNWRVIVSRNGLNQTLYQNPNQIFTRNFASFLELNLGESIRQNLDLNGGNWCGFGFCGSYSEKGFAGMTMTVQSGDVITVVYDVRRSRESDLYHVWYGVASATAKFQ